MPLTPVRKFWPLLLLLVVSTVLWMYTTDRWHPAEWSLPAQDSGDLLEVAARIQIAREQAFTLGNTYGSIARLGYPEPANWSLYPVPDRPTFFIAGLVARFVGTLATINVMMWFGHLLAAAGFFLAARLLRWSLPWALAGAILFAYCTHNFRWAGTISLSYTFAWPVALVLFHWTVGRQPPRGGTQVWRRVAVGCGLVLGLGNPYFTFLAGQLGGFALLRQRLHRQVDRARVAALFLAALAASFIISQAGYFIALFQPHAEEKLERNFAGTELYALRPIDLLIPPADHWLQAWGRLGHRYRSSSLFHSAEPSVYLGLIALIGLGLLAWTTFRRLETHGLNARKIPEATLAVGWILIFAMVGGINTVLGLGGFDLFRATSRYSLILLIIGLFCCLGWLRHRVAYRPRLKLALALAVVFVGLWDQLPPPQSNSLRRAMQARVDRDRDTAAALVAALGPQAKVFQFPVVPFPEAGSRLQFPDYEHFRLFLYAPEFQLSYGGLRGSYADKIGRWVAQHPLAQVPAALATGGFNAVTIDRRAFADQGESLITAFASVGLKRITLPATSVMVAFALDAAPANQLPAADDPRYLEAWAPSPSSRQLWPDEAVPTAAGPARFVASGWLAPETDGRHQWRWSNQSTATLALFDPRPSAPTITVSLQLSSIKPSQVEIQWAGQSVWKGNVDANLTAVTLADLPFTPGAAQLLNFSYDGAFHRGRYDLRELGLKVSDLEARYSP